MQATVENIRAALFGLAIGDALGVPAEFKGRSYFKNNPVTGMSGYGTHGMPPGTFSDDSSLAFCLAEALTQEFSLHTIADNFIKWRYNNFWTATGRVFDIGNATQEAIYRLRQGAKPDLAGGFSEEHNGNGSLMRILPLLFYIHGKPIEDRFIITKHVSSITHAHMRSVIACFYYLEFARLLLYGKNKRHAYSELKLTIPKFLQGLGINEKEVSLFSRLLSGDIFTLPEDKIDSSGYVLHTLEASIWSLLTTTNYRDATLLAVNLGSDTDTTGAVTGGLAGLLYGFEDIPAEWVKAIARKDDIEDLAVRLAAELL